MTVSIDPSEVRRQATVNGQPSVQPAGCRTRRPLRVILLGGLGGAGLLAFTIGAFSFFGGLADPRVRNPRPAPLASKMPDLKDGLPVLVNDGRAVEPVAAVLNLPKPPASPPVPVPVKAEAALRSDAPAAVQASAEPTDRPAPAARSAESTGSVAQTTAPAARAKATPGIENARTVSGDAKPVALIAPARTAGPLAPAKAETIRAKPATVAALPAEHEPPAPAAASKQAAPESKVTEKSAEKSVKKPAQKVARAKAKPVAEASAEPEAAAARPAASEPDDDGITAKVKGGLKAIGGLFGQD